MVKAVRVMLEPNNVQQTKNQGKGKDTGVLPDIPDERKTIQAIQG